MATKRKMWTSESMAAAVDAVKQEGKTLRAASRLYNVPLETLRRRVTGSVELDCKPGPKTVLSKEEEDRLVEYCVEMADRGFGLMREDVMRLAFQIAERTKPHDHPFKDGLAGRGWYEGFRSHHPNLTVRSPQPLSYCRAISANPAVISDFFAKLGAVCGRLNLFTKPMQIYNLDETGLTVVHKCGKVIADVSRRHVYSLTSAEKGKTHTVLSCVSASGIALPPDDDFSSEDSCSRELSRGCTSWNFV